MKLLLAVSDSLKPHQNQEHEAALMDLADEDTAVLYLWANDKVVFIGKNQNAFLECNLDALKRDGGVLARRITGGGAVYHDKGNLNYTFIAGRKLYDESRQFDIVLSAIRSLNIDAQKSGRNDLTVDGKKFSGNAFFRGERVGLHHGTILINSSYTQIAKYLSASKIKLAAKGVASVAARVVNLSEFAPKLDKSAIITSFITAAEDSYGVAAQKISLQKNENYQKWYNLFTDNNRLLGDNIYFDARVEKRFEWGTCDIRLKLSKNTIVDAKIYSDGLDTDLIGRKQNALIGQDIYNVTNQHARDIIESLDIV